MKIGIKKVVDPSGCWEYDQLLGAKVRIRSMSVCNFFGTMTSVTDINTIKDIYYRITLDGKVMNVIELEEFPGKVFTWRDLEVIEINNLTREKPICGCVITGQCICGYKVSSDATYLEDLGKNGITIIDENGNIIKDRYIRLENANIEDITTDTDNITDINFKSNGGILD